MRRYFLFFLVAIALVYGGAYASALLFRVMGPWNAVAIEHDGSQTHMAFGQNLPRPDWVPVYTGATIVTASRLTSLRTPSGFHSLDLATRGSFDDVKNFYRERLAAADFTVTDNGLGPLSPPVAAYLGIAGSLSGRRASTDDQIEVMIRTPDGLVPSRLIELRWHKISEVPAVAARP